MLITAYDTLSEMKLLDSQGAIIADLIWKNPTVSATNSDISDDDGYESKYNTEQWITREIPIGKEIIGLYCNTSGDVRYIKSLGFVLWTPN